MLPSEIFDCGRNCGWREVSPIVRPSPFSIRSCSIDLRPELSECANRQSAIYHTAADSTAGRRCASEYSGDVLHAGNGTSVFGVVRKPNCTRAWFALNPVKRLEHDAAYAFLDLRRSRIHGCRLGIGGINQFNENSRETQPLSRSEAAHTVPFKSDLPNRARQPCQQRRWQGYCRSLQHHPERGVRRCSAVRVRRHRGH